MRPCNFLAFLIAFLEFRFCCHPRVDFCVFYVFYVFYVCFRAHVRFRLPVTPGPAPRRAGGARGGTALASFTGGPR